MPNLFANCTADFAQTLWQRSWRLIATRPWGTSDLNVEAKLSATCGRLWRWHGGTGSYDIPAFADVDEFSECEDARSPSRARAHDLDDTRTF